MPKTISTYQATKGKLPTQKLTKKNFALPSMSQLKTKAKDTIRKGVVKFIGDTPAGKLLKKGLDKQGLKY